MSQENISRDNVLVVSNPEWMDKMNALNSHNELKHKELLWINKVTNVVWIYFTGLFGHAAPNSAWLLSLSKSAKSTKSANEKNTPTTKHNVADAFSRVVTDPKKQTKQKTTNKYITNAVVLWIAKEVLLMYTVKRNEGFKTMKTVHIIMFFLK